MHWEPKNFHVKGVKFCVGRMAAALFWDPGLGKTSTLYETFRILKKAQRAEGMLVVSPLRPALSVWPREAAKWDQFRDLNVHVLHGPEKERLLETPHDVTVINPEGLPWLLGYEDSQGKWVKGAASPTRGKWWDVLTVDESTMFKHTESLRFKILKPWLKKFPRRYILTGDPAPNGLMDLFGQMYLLDYGHSLGQYVTRFRNSYFDATGFGGYTYKIKDKAEEEIYKKLRPYVLRMAAEDYLDMPPLIIPDPIEVDLPPKARKAYDQMENLLMAEIEDGIITAANVGAATSKCRQIANGGIITDSESRHFTHLHDAKTDALKELVEELRGKPLLVAYEFGHDLARLRRAFPKAPWLGGGVSRKRQIEIEDAWNSGAIPILLGQPQSVARGLNLQGTAGHVAYYSTPWDLEIYRQFYKRIWRQGQKERVFLYHFVARNTIDFAVQRALKRKAKVQQALFDALREDLRERKRAA